MTATETPHLPALRINTGGSKSLSNRWIILSALLQQNVKLFNLSASQDTATLLNALHQLKKTSPTQTIHVGMAGTAMRFLTAFLATRPGDYLLMGDERMHHRPIAELVSSLQNWGADIQYLNQHGYPPLKIKQTLLHAKDLTLSGTISSQFISALLLLVPHFNKNISFAFSQTPVSRPYIEMTLTCLAQLGYTHTWHSNVLTLVAPATLQIPQAINLESDWSSASYWYSCLSLCKSGSLLLQHLHPDSSQGDSVLSELFAPLGVCTQFCKDGAILTKTEITQYPNEITLDCTAFPDLAQTLAFTYAALNIPCTLKGLTTLNFKESKRIETLQQELTKLGHKTNISHESITIQPKPDWRERTCQINTHHDHRIAMSAAPLLLVNSSLEIENPGVVSKSYPLFWEHFKAFQAMQFPITEGIH